MPQEPGIRSARALPYRLAADFAAAEGGAKLHLANTGGQGACFYLYAQGSAAFPWHYTVGTGDVLDVAVPSGSARLMLYGPNGFFRSFAPGASGLAVRAATENEVLKLAFSNQGNVAMAVTLADNAYGRGVRKLTVPASGEMLEEIDLASNLGWYDVTVFAGEEIWRLAGHAETGRPSFTDPAAKAPVLSWV
jgi:phospholipase C